jgi:two-component system OmpR family sensor kinase
MANWSIVSRLIWLLTSTLAGLWLLGSVAAGLLTLFEVNERLDNALEEVAQRLLPATADALQAPHEMRQLAEQMVPAMGPRALAYQILSTTGRVVLRSENAPEAPFSLPLLFFLPASWLLIPLGGAPEHPSAGPAAAGNRRA